MYMMTGASKSLFHIEFQRRHLLFSSKRHKEITGRRTEKKLAELDYKEFIKNPAGYFVNKEHWSLDGG